MRFHVFLPWRSRLVFSEKGPSTGHHHILVNSFFSCHWAAKQCTTNREVLLQVLLVIHFLKRMLWMLDHEWRPRKYYLELWKTLAQIVLHTQNKNQSWLSNQSRWKWDRSIIKLIGMLRLRMYGWVVRAKKWHLPVRHNKEWFFMFFHFWMCSPLSWRQLKFHIVLHLKCNKYKKSKKPYQVYEK